MKRPGPRKESISSKALPKTQASVTPISIKLDKKTSHAIKSLKAGKRTNPIGNNSQLARSARTKRVGLFSKLSPEAKRFVVASRRRKIAALVIFGAFGLLGSLILATIFTPLLAIEKLEVTGTHRINQKTVMNALRGQLGVPLTMVSNDSIAKALEPFSLVESFATVSLPPHTLRIAITERQPICIVTVAGIDYLYDPAGVRIGVGGKDDKYPRIAIAGDPRSSQEFTAAIDVLLALPSELLSRITSVDAKSKDDVSMRLRGNAGQRIIWGDGSRSVLKSRVLAALIRNQKSSDYVIFDVSSPSAPVVRYGNF